MGTGRYVRTQFWNCSESFLSCETPCEASQVSQIRVPTSQKTQKPCEALQCSFVGKHSSQPSQMALCHLRRSSLRKDFSDKIPCVIYINTYISMVKLVRVTTIPVTPTMTTIFAMFLKSNIDTHPHKNRSLFLLRMQRKKRHLHPMISWRENHQNVRVGIDTSNYNFVTTTMRTRTMLRYATTVVFNEI